MHEIIIRKSISNPLVSPMPILRAKLDFAGILTVLPLIGTCTQGVLEIIFFFFFFLQRFKINRYLYLRGSCN